MNRLLINAFLMVAGLFLLLRMSPAFVGQGEQAGADDTEAPAAQAMDIDRKQDWNTNEAMLHRERDGHFYANVRVNGGEYRFLVDTGASIVALTGEDAEAMGLQWDAATLRTIGRGASGDVRGVPVTLDSVEINGIEKHGVPAAIIPEGLDTSLLGQSYLGQLRNVDISGDAMTLGD